MEGSENTESRFRKLEQRQAGPWDGGGELGGYAATAGGKLVLVRCVGKLG